LQNYRGLRVYAKSGFIGRRQRRGGRVRLNALSA
jgi:hypothetical protein